LRSAPIPFGVQAYQSRSVPWSAQSLVNWYPETAPQTARTKTPVVLLPTPGLTLFSTVSGECRGTITMGGVFYAVMGTTFYMIGQNGTALSLGTIPGTNLCSLAASDDQVTIVCEPRAWVYTRSTNTLEQITDADFPGSAFVTWVGGYFVHVKPGTDGQFFVSDLNSGLEFDALNFATAEMDGDALVAAYGDHGELWLFGTKTAEPWGQTGAVDFPFAPIQSARIQRGIASRFSISRQDNSLFWIGDDLIVYRANGYTPTRVSTHAIEKALEEAKSEIDGVMGGYYTQDGHSFVMFSLPDWWTFFYDNATGLWHERKTYNIDHWKARFPQPCYGKMLTGYEDGNIYEMTLDTYTEAGGIIRREAVSPAFFANTSRVTISRLQIDFQSGMGLNNGQGSDPQAMLQWSKDGGQTWGYEHWRSMGKIGEYGQRVIWRQLGQAYQWVFRVSVSDAVFPAIIGAYADFDVTPA